MLPLPLLMLAVAAPKLLAASPPAPHATTRCRGQSKGQVSSCRPNASAPGATSSPMDWLCLRAKVEHMNR